jgi:hypothetical protein
VSNSTKDLLYETALEVARDHHPEAYQRLSEDDRLVGCYQVSGVGFDLAAFAEAFGNTKAWLEATAREFGAVDALCSDAIALQHMTKVMAWCWFLLDGGRCNDARGRHPDLNDLPESPGQWTPPPLAASSNPGLDVGWLCQPPSILFKFAFGIGFGSLVGALVGAGTMLLGLAQNWRVIPAWVFSGALLGSAHPTVDAILNAISRLPDKSEGRNTVSETNSTAPKPKPS